MPDPIALAVPLFFVLIAIELWWARRRGVSVYRFGDALTDLSCGITSQIVLLVWATTQLWIYAEVYARFRLVTYEHPAVAWVIAFLGVDFLYYWWHRLSHEVNVLWAAHVVHHQSEDYNLAVALRQSVITSWTGLPFYLPLALLGVPTVVYATVHALSTLYQFWIHTQLVGKVRGPIDWIFNLPSHHRVHHAINRVYLDKNYGATLIVWDRLFGTYAEEVEEPVYGLTKPLGSFDPMWAQIHYWFEMARMARTATKPGDKLRVWFASPAWKPEPPPAPVPIAMPRPDEASPRDKYDRPISQRLRAYLGANYVVIVAATFAIMMWHGSLPRVAVLAGSIAVLAALFSFGTMLEKRRWAWQAEGVRIAVSIAALAVVVTSMGCRRGRQKDVRVVTIEGPSAVLPRVERTPPRATETRTSSQLLEVPGKGTRKYVLVEPTAPVPDGKKLPLVLVLHGDGGDMTGFHQAWRFEEASGTEAILAYPDGIGSTWDLETTRDNRDVRFMLALVDELAAKKPIDRARVFAAGYSSGGFFANVLACQQPKLLRAIASNAGGAPYNQREKWPNGFPKCPGQEPIATLALHGERDFGVTIDSGRFSAEYWAYVNGCRTEEMETTGYAECRLYRGCPGGKAVGFCDVPSLGHWVWDRSADASWTFFLATEQAAPRAGSQE